jgi:AmiR/NasT family two-component response regulator
VNLIQAFADVATIGILQERAIRHSSETATQLQSALNSRVVIEQAKGIVAERHDLGMDESFSLLRGYARFHRIRLSDVARSLIDGSLPAAQLITTRDESRSSSP